MTSSGPARTAARLLPAVALIMVIGTGCSPARAGGENPATTGAPTGDAGDQHGPTGAAPSPAERQELLQERRAFARCVRDNGVKDFPDPDANGYILYYGNDPDVDSARQKCDEHAGPK